VRSAEELLHSASANIGVAVANMLPSLTLAAGRGYTATDLASLFTGPNIFWSVAGNATQTLFDGFNLLHLERAAVALYDQAAWNYRTTVIGAFQNVADSLRAIQNDADALKASRDFEKAAKVSLDLAQQQMQTGNANVLLLLNAQVTYENAVISLVTAQANRVSDTAALYQALGGGWWNRNDLAPKVDEVAAVPMHTASEPATPAIASAPSADVPRGQPNAASEIHN
jgi:outer membrane protein TolC